MRVLFVDDDRINAMLFEELCRMAGDDIELRTAEDGAQALQWASNWSPDLLVIDLHLPDTDGCALLPRLRACVGRPELPAYLCTAEMASEALPKAARAGFTGCWIKPLSLPQLRQHLARHATGGAAP